MYAAQQHPENEVTPGVPECNDPVAIRQMPSRLSTGYGRRAKRCNAMSRVVIFGCLGMALFGYDTGIVSGAMILVRNDIKMTVDEAELVVSITMLLAAIATIFGIPFNSWLGRKPVIMSAALLYMVGSGLIAVAADVWHLVLGRALLGVAIGFASGTVPMYSAELALPAYRGMIVTLNDLNIVVGQLLAAMMNVCFQHVPAGWRWSMGFAALPAAWLFFGILFLPESPRWLAMKGRYTDAEAVLKMLYEQENVSGPLNDIKAAIAQSGEAREGKRSLAGLLKRGWSKITIIWGKKEVQRAALLGIGLMALNQFSGINTVMYYSTTILVEAGFSQEISIWLAALCCLAQLVGVCISVASMDNAGRRPTALRSCFGVVVTLSTLAVSFYFESPLWDKIKVAALMLYLVAFGSGLSGVPWVMNAEIYPLKLRSAAVGQATVANWLFNFLVGRYFLSVCDWLGTGGAFFLFAGFSVFGLLWLWLLLPETMGLQLEEIDDLFADPYPSTFRAKNGETTTADKVGGHQRQLKMASDSDFDSSSDSDLQDDSSESDDASPDQNLAAAAA